jgi:hypothetical protein
VRHAPLSYGTLQRAAALDALRASFTPRPGHTLSIAEILRDEADGRLVRTREVDRDEDGSEIEQDHLVMATYRDGLLDSVEYWDVDQLDVAVARFDPPEPRTRRLDNAMVRVFERWTEAHNRGDVAGIRALCADDFVHQDRRQLVGHEDLGLDATMAIHEQNRAAGLVELIATPVAIRGDHLALGHCLWLGEGIEDESYTLGELDEAGRVRLTVTYAADQLRIAFADLDERYRATLPADVAACMATQRRFLDAYVAGDPVGPLVTDDFVVIDHQELGFGTFDREAAITAFAIAAQRPNGFVVVVEEIVALDSHGSVVRSSELEVNAAGGETELANLTVTTVEGDRVSRVEFFAADDVEAALARYRELTGA